MDNFKRAKSLTLILLVVAVIMTVAVLRGQNQNKSTSEPSQEATPIQEGVISEKQRTHSKLYKGYGGRTNISEQVRKNRDLEYVMKSEPSVSSLEKLTCESDAIIVGLIQDKSSQLTEDKNFIFTDYDLTVEEIWKDNSKRPIDQSSLLTLTRPGGVIKLNNKVVRAKDTAFVPLAIGGHYLLFLRYIADTNSYSAINSAGSFAVDGARINELRKNQIVEIGEAGSDIEGVRAKVNAAIVNCNSVKGGN